ncbi:MAG: HEAT repeat domain-containing protein, partial [Polyangiaceae bacterium]|nr:HEAT repeat domain-containing protein [Polyangiaceae bacterium]
VAIRGEAMKPLVESCLQAGDPHISPPLDKTLAYGKKDRRKAEPNASVEVRTAAVEALEKVAPAEAEARACALYRAETQQEIRVACVQVMGIGEQDTTLEMLLEALKDTDDVSRAAVQSLQRFRHPKTTERVLALLTREVLDLKPYRPPRAKASRQISQAQQGQQKAEKKVLAIIAERSAWIRRAIQVLGRRPSPEVLDKLIDLYTHHPISVIRETAGEALKASGERRAMEVLIQHLDREGDATEALAVWAFFHLDLNTVFERMQPFLTEQALSTKKGLAIAAKLLAEISGDGQFLDMVEDDREESKKDDTIDADVIPELEGDGTILEEEVRMAAPYLARKLARYPFCQDPRWADVALRLLPRKELTGFCIGILGNLRDPRGRDPLLALLRRNIHPYDAAQGLFRIGDRSIVPNLIELLSLKGPRSAVIQLLGSFKAQEAVEPLCALLTEEIEGTNQIFEALRCIGDPRAASAIAAALCHKNIRTYPYQALRALRQLDNPAAIPSLQEAMKMLKRSKHSWLVSQYEELIHYLERDRKV